MRITSLPLLAAALVASVSAQQPVDLDLGSTLHDIAFDGARSRAYVSLPSEGRIAIVDTNNWIEIGTYQIGAAPRGLALSIDESRLFVAKSGAGSVVTVDLNTGTQSEIFLTAQLDNAATYDVIEARPNELFVSAAPGSGGFAYIVKVDLDGGNAAQRVASNRIIRCNPTFEVNPDRTSLYVGACFSPNSIYRLDLTQDSAPIVAEDDHGSVGGTSHIEVSPNGDRVHLRGGQILDALTLDVVGNAGGTGIQRFDVDPTRVFITGTPNRIETWNSVTGAQVDSVTIPCSFSSFNGLREFEVLEGESGFIVLTGTRVCGIADVPPCISGVANHCTSLPNSTGVPASLEAVGEARISLNAFALDLVDAPPQQFAILIFGQAGSPLPLGNGLLCLDPFQTIHRFPTTVQLSPAGAARLELDFTALPLVTGPITAYSTWTFQAWFRDGVGAGLNTSSAIGVTFCP